MLESEAPTHKERKARVCRVVAGRGVAVAARGGAVAGDGDQRPLRARGPRSRWRPSTGDAAHAPAAAPRPCSPRPATSPAHAPQPTHSSCCTACTALGTVTGPAHTETIPSTMSFLSQQTPICNYNYRCSLHLDRKELPFRRICVILICSKT